MVHESDTAKYYLNSNFIEQMVEHEFISRVIQYVWFTEQDKIEILRSEIDDYGYDIVLEYQGIMRHIQLKTSIKGGSTRTQKLNLALTQKVGGCIIWIEREECPDSQQFKFEYLFYGSKANEQFVIDHDLKVAKSTKANAEGFKSERKNIRVVPKSKFTKVSDMRHLMHLLFDL